MRLLAWTGVSLLIAQLCLGSPTRIGDANPGVLVAAILVVAALLNVIKRLPTQAGRREIVVFVRRFLHHEWWPSWVLYTLLVPHFLRLAVRHRSLTVWTCVNPGIEPGGGIVGESKIKILAGLDDAHALKQVRIPAGDAPGVRATAALSMINQDTAVGYPVVIKPEAGERGDRVAIAHDADKLTDALSVIPEPAIVQRYHPGPIELGVFWVRDAATIGDERTATAHGSILGVTRKILPEIICDGDRTIREQILTHPRFRMQASVYFENLRNHGRGRLDETPQLGESVRLTDIGNHVRGARFEDGADVITRELTEAIDRIARTWRGAGGEPFDFGRFDLRCSSEAAARRGEDLAVIELNGVTSEATNLYDPSWSPLRAHRLLARQWTIACALGAVRRAQGARPIGITGIVRALLSARRG